MAEGNQNLLTAYSFLAALTESQNNLYDSVYVPICKRALSIYSAQRKSHGSLDDIQDVILDEFDIKIPGSFVKRLLRSVSQQMSNNEKNTANFNLFENGQHFSIGRYAFVDLELKLKRGRREALAVQIAFEEYLKEEQELIEETYPFAEFLKKNNSRLASFFAGKKINDDNSLERSYYHHVQFLHFVESSNHQIYTVIESMYLGSIVASFLEADFDFEAKFTSGESYYLDTPFILRVLDLQKEEDCKAAQELIELIKNTGGKLKVLCITVDELQGILEKAIQQYNTKYPTSTINEACHRRDKNKTFLIQLASKLETILVENFGLVIENVTNQQKEKYVKSNDLRILKARRIRTGTAEHDVLAYLYVRDARNGIVQSFQKAKAWFLTTNTGLLFFNRETLPFQGISEIVLPDALTSLLWLRNPVQLTSQVKNAGLSELMAVTISEEIASKELISDFEATISSIKEITGADYKILLNSVAYESARKIEKFIDKVIREPEHAAIEAQKLIEKERRRRNNEQQRIKNANTVIKKEQEIKEELATKIANIENDLIEFSDANSVLRNSRDQDRTLLENLQQEILSYRKATSKWIVSLIIFVIIVIFAFFAWYNWTEIFNRFKLVWNGILGIGAAWSFGSFLINLIKAIKRK